MTDELSTLKAQLARMTEMRDSALDRSSEHLMENMRVRKLLRESEQRERELRELMLRVNPFVESALERESQAPANHQLFQQQARMLMSKWQAALRSAPPSAQVQDSYTPEMWRKARAEHFENVAQDSARQVPAAATTRVETSHRHGTVRSGIEVQPSGEESLDEKSAPSTPRSVTSDVGLGELSAQTYEQPTEASTQSGPQDSPSRSLSLEELAAAQGVKPITDTKALHMEGCDIDGDWLVAQRRSEWIRVEERLPEANVFVLVYLDSDWIGQSFMFSDKTWSYGRVTHWKPLPAPPSRASEKENRNE